MTPGTGPAIARDARPAIRIGPRLRAARRARGWTLDHVAAATSLTKGFLSRLERDDVSASVASLVSVCDALGLRVGDLFDPPVTEVVRAGEGRAINFGGHGVTEHLITPGTRTQLQVIHAVIDAGGGGGAEPYTLAADAECVYVLRGRLRVVVSGGATHLGPGDAMTFSPRAAHTWANDSQREACAALWMLSPAP